MTRALSTPGEPTATASSGQVREHVTVGVDKDKDLSINFWEE